MRIKKQVDAISDNEKGIVLVVVLLLLAALIILGTTAVMQTSTDLKISSNYKTRVQAFYIAEAGLAKAEAELINDLNTDQDIANTTFNQISGSSITITPSSTSFYTVFDSISFGAGDYTIQFMNYGTSPNYNPATVLVRSTGTGPNSSTVTLESYLSAENISPWNNATFSGGGGGPAPITGNVSIAGSIHILGEGLDPATTVFSNQTGDCLNTNVGMDSDLADAIYGGTTSDLNAKFRIKNGLVNMSVGSADIGSSSNPFKGIYVTDGDAGAYGVNADIIGGDNAGASQNLYADKGAFSARAYDLEEYNTTLPRINDTELTAISLDLTGVTDSTEDFQFKTSAGASIVDTVDDKGLINGNLELTEKFKVKGKKYYPDIEKYDGTDWTSSTNAIRFNSATNVLEIKGIVKVLSLNISDDITYKTVPGPAGKKGGTIYTTGTTEIDGDVLPAAAASYPTTNVFGVISTGDMTLPSKNKLLTGAYYTEGTATSSGQTELAGTIVCENFDITKNVPKIWQVPSLATNLPPGMPGAAAVWVFTDRTWREITE